MKKNKPRTATQQEFYLFIQDFPWLNKKTMAKKMGINPSRISTGMDIDVSALRKFSQLIRKMLMGSIDGSDSLKKYLNRWVDRSMIKAGTLADSAGIDPTQVSRWLRNQRTVENVSGFMNFRPISVQKLNLLFEEVERFREGGKTLVRKPVQN